MEGKEKVLIVEDDLDLVDLLKIHLSDIGFTVDSADQGRAGLAKALEGKYDLIVLDLMLPGYDGMEICRRVREKDNYTPILMLTAKTEEVEKVLGLELGADDYITKPFSIREFIARVKAIRRRVKEIRKESQDEKDADILEYGKLTINFKKRSVSLSGNTIDLTAKEYDLLILFAGHPGQAFSRQQLLENVWGYQFDGYNHTVNSHINRLRNKIEKDPSRPKYLKTVWGFGYKFAEPGEL